MFLQKKKPFWSEKAFFLHYGFEVVDSIDDYELLALSFNTKIPKFNECIKNRIINDKGITIYYSHQCPYTHNSINEIEAYCQENNIDINIIYVNSLEMAKNVPCIFNNWATFKNGIFVSNTILNKNSFIKLYEEKQ